MFFDPFDFSDMFSNDPISSAFQTAYNNTSKNKLEILELRKNNRVCYVAVITCPGVERKDINIDFSDMDGNYFPTLRVSGQTKTNLGTYKVDVGGTICLPTPIRLCDDGTVLKNGILYVYFEPVTAQASRKRSGEREQRTVHPIKDDKPKNTDLDV